MILENNGEQLLQLPPLSINTMTQVQLAEFIPQLLKLSTGGSAAQFDKLQDKPNWWPEAVPWANPAQEVMKDKEETAAEMLRDIVRSCYKHLGQENLLSAANLPSEVTEMSQADTRTSEGASAAEDCSSDDDRSVWICFVCAKEFANQGELMRHQDACEETEDNPDEAIPTASEIQMQIQMSDLPPMDLEDPVLVNVRTLLQQPAEVQLQPPQLTAPVQLVPQPSLTEPPLLHPPKLYSIQQQQSVAGPPQLVVPQKLFYRAKRRRKRWPDVYIPPPPEEYFTCLGLGPTPKVEEILNTPKKNAGTVFDPIEVDLYEDPKSPVPSQSNTSPTTPQTPRSLMSQLSRDEGSARKRHLSLSHSVSVGATKESMDVDVESDSDSESSDDDSSQDGRAPRKTIKSSLLGIDITSALGLRLKGNFNSDNYIPAVWNVDEYCRDCDYHMFERNDVMDKLRQRPAEIPITFKATKKYLSRYCHKYKFNKRDRRQFTITLRTGLNEESRKLIRCLRPCRVKMARLTAKEIKFWTTKRQRSVYGHFAKQFAPRTRPYLPSRPFLQQNLLLRQQYRAMNRMPQQLIRNPFQMGVVQHRIPGRPSLSSSYPSLYRHLSPGDSLLLNQGRPVPAPRMMPNLAGPTPLGPTPQLLVRTITDTENGQEAMRLEVVPILNHRDPNTFSMAGIRSYNSPTSSPKRDATGSQKRKQNFQNVRNTDDEISIISLSSDEEDSQTPSNNCCTGCRNKTGGPCSIHGKGEVKSKPKIGPASVMRRLSQQGKILETSGQNGVLKNSPKKTQQGFPPLPVSTVTEQSKPVARPNWFQQVKIINGMVKVQSPSKSNADPEQSASKPDNRPGLFTVFSENVQSEVSDSSKPGSLSGSNSVAKEEEDFEIIVIDD